MPSLMQRSCRIVLPALVLVGLSTAGVRATSAEQFNEPQQEYKAQIQQKDWDAAIGSAQQLVAAARQQAGQNPRALADALSKLGDAQFGKTDYMSAGAAYQEALDIVTQREGAASTALIGPLRGVGKTLAMTGHHREAVPVLERALVLTRRTYGLFDARQRDVLRYLVTSLTALQSPEAERHVSYMLQMAERTYGSSDPRLVPWLCVIGNWYADTGNYPQGRAHYRRALEIVERKLGRNDPAAVPPLRELARSYTQELRRSLAGMKSSLQRALTDADGTPSDRRPVNPRHLNNDGEDALERALHILDSQPDPDRNLLVLTLIDLGDWYQIKHLPDKALPMYRRAAQLVANDNPPQINENQINRSQSNQGQNNPPPGTAAQADAAKSDPPKAGASMTAPLSFPVRVYYPVPLLATRNTTLPDEAVTETYVEVEFTVTDSGDVVNARITDQNGTQRQASEALQAIRGARFRPKFIDGVPVATQGMTSREVFRTRKSDETSRRDT